MRKVIAITFLFLLLCSTCLAMPADKTAHFGVGYILNDQLSRHTHLTFIERIGAVYLVAYMKERGDNTFDQHDINATLLGAVVYQIRF